MTLPTLETVMTGWREAIAKIEAEVHEGLQALPEDQRAATETAIVAKIEEVAARFTVGFVEGATAAIKQLVVTGKGPTGFDSTDTAA